MKGQTTIHPCWFCEEPAVEEVVVVPSRASTDKTGKRIMTLAINGWVCPAHKQRLEAEDGWQERERKERAARSAAWKKEQLKLGDAA